MDNNNKINQMRAKLRSKGCKILFNSFFSFGGVLTAALKDEAISLGFKICGAKIIN